MVEGMLLDDPGYSDADNQEAPGEIENQNDEVGCHGQANRAPSVALKESMDQGQPDDEHNAVFLGHERERESEYRQDEMSAPSLHVQEERDAAEEEGQQIGAARNPGHIFGVNRMNRKEQGANRTGGQAKVQGEQYENDQGAACRV